jgi:zinc transport system ATP-binding protein
MLIIRIKVHVDFLDYKLLIANTILETNGYWGGIPVGNVMAIELSHVNVFFDDVCALYNINLKVKEKEFMGIIGPNGGGKTTLLKVILGLIKPSAGSVRVLGLPPAESHGYMGYVPQYSKFDRRFPINVKDVVLMGRLHKSGPFLHRYSSQDEKRANEVMKQMEVYDLAHRQIGQLSGGQMQRVLIARALVLEPQIILLDEPTASLDSYSKSHICSLLKELNESMTVVMVTHDMGVISSYVESIACLNQELIYHGGPELDTDILGKAYGCPIELIAHGVPHRVLHEHAEDSLND